MTPTRPTLGVVLATWLGACATDDSGLSGVTPGSGGGDGGGGGSANPELCTVRPVRPLFIGAFPDLASLDALLQEGRIPAESNLRPEDMVADRSLEITESCCNGPVCLEASLANVRGLATGAPASVLQVSLVTDAERPMAPRTVILVLDVSDTLHRAVEFAEMKRAIQSFIAAVEPGAQVGVVGFDGSANVLVDAGPVEEVRDKALAVVDRIELLGGRHIRAVLRVGFDEAEKALLANRDTRVLVITDGEETIRIADVADMMDQAAPYFAQGIHLGVIALGNTGRLAWLRDFALKTGLRLTIDEDEFNLADHLNDELTLRMTPLATALDFRVEAPSGTELGAFAGWASEPSTVTSARVLMPALVQGGDGRAETPGFPLTASGPAMVFELHPAGQVNGPIIVEGRYRPHGAEAYVSFRKSLSLPDGWPGRLYDDDVAARELLASWHVGRVLTEAITLWNLGAPEIAYERTAKLEAVLQDYPREEGRIDPDIARDLWRTKTLLKIMAAGFTAPAVTLPENPWPDN